MEAGEIVPSGFLNSYVDTHTVSKMQSPRSLRSRIIGASAWVIFGHTFSQVLRLGGNLIMTRLLVPEMFGLMAIASVFLVGIGMFSDFGLRQSIIRSNRGDDPVFLNTVWTVQIIRGGLIWFLSVGLAIAVHLMAEAHIWPVNSTYVEPVLPYVIGAICFSAVINGFDSTKVATANRNLSLGLISRIEILSQASGIIFMVLWALVDRSIWALVLGSLFGSALKAILGHVWMPGLSNKLYWDAEAFREIFHFGKWIFITSILGFIVGSGDKLLLGGLFDSTILGLYAIAFILVGAAQQICMKIIRSVALPALSEVVRERPGELKRVYYKFRKPVDAITLFATGVLFMSGGVLIELLYDDRYLEAGYMIEILSLTLFMERYTLTGSCLVALGKPKLLVPIIVVRIIALFSLLPLMNTLYGLTGALWVIASSRLFSLPLVLYFQKKYVFLDVSRELQVLPILIIGALFGYLLEILWSLWVVN